MPLSADQIRKLQDKARQLRCDMVDVTVWAGGAHIGGALSMADVLTALYYHYLDVRPDEPDWQERDRFVLSKGHGGVGLAPVLADKGYFDKELLKEFNHFKSPFGMHLDGNKVKGVDASTGSLGHGLSMALGMALGARFQKQAWRTYCLLGDGECDEGSVWEAAMAAAHYKADNLTAFVDRNHMMIDGLTEDVMSLEPLADKWRAFGWDVREIDGHDFAQIGEAIEGAQAKQGAPTVIICDTVKGKGVDFMEGEVKWHYGSIDSELAAKAKASIMAGGKAGAARRRGRCVMTEVTGTTWNVYDANTLTQAEIYGRVLCDLAEADPRIVAVTADLARSTKIGVFQDKFPQRVFNVGIAEQNLFGVAAGMAKSGLLPFVSTMSAFASMRALEQVRTDICYQNLDVKIIATHGGVSFGQAGTTHHCTEDIAIQRSLANMTLIVPADGWETANAVRAAVKHPGPVYIRLGRGFEPTHYENDDYGFEIGKAVTVSEGTDITVIACGVAVLPRRRGRQAAQGPGRHQRPRARRAHHQAHRRGGDPQGRHRDAAHPLRGGAQRHRRAGQRGGRRDRRQRQGLRVRQDGPARLLQRGRLPRGPLQPLLHRRGRHRRPGARAAAPRVRGRRGLGGRVLMAVATRAGGQRPPAGAHPRVPARPHLPARGAAVRQGHARGRPGHGQALQERQRRGAVRGQEPAASRGRVPLVRGRDRPYRAGLLGRGRPGPRAGHHVHVRLARQALRLLRRQDGAAVHPRLQPPGTARQGAPAPAEPEAHAAQRAAHRPGQAPPQGQAHALHDHHGAQPVQQGRRPGHAALDGRQPDRIYQFSVEPEGIAAYLRVRGGQTKAGRGVYQRRRPFVHMRFRAWTALSP